MRHTTRKEFLQTSGLLLGAAFAKIPFDIKKDKMPLAFSTLGCPDWSFQKITNFAVQHGYTGIEIRGLMRQVDLTKTNELTKDKEASLKMMKNKKLRFVDLGSSCTLHFNEGADREKNINEG